MRIITSILIVVLFGVSNLSSQTDRRDARMEERESRLDAKKVGYITDQLDLTTEEAQKFWPIYNDYHKRTKVLREKGEGTEENMDEMSEVDADQYIKNMLTNERARVDLKADYYQNLESVLPKRKIAKLDVLEKRFRNKVYKSIKKRMNRKERGKNKSKRDADN